MPVRRAICFSFALLSLAAVSAGAQDAALPPPDVGVVSVNPQAVPKIVTVPGRAVAQAQAAIRPRVGGLITEILYDPGTALEPGAPMFRIDPTTYLASLSSAEADVTSARAALAEAEITFDRTQRLVGSGTTQAQVDSARATLEQAQATVQSAQAAQTPAQADVDWTTVTSPIDGMASVAAVSVGDLVTAGQAQALATVTRLDPIEVDMYEPSARMLAVIGDITEGRLTMNERLQATLTLETGETYAATGELVAPGTTVSTTTGSIDARFRFDNPNHLILPGMFLRGQVDLGTVNAFLVSQTAASRDRTGQLSAWVVRDGKAQQVDLTDDGTYQNHWIVTEGLRPGDMLAVDNLAVLSDGMDVTPIPVMLDANGVVRPADPAPDPAAQPATQPAAEPASEPAR